jgi:hypothetical protein
VVGPVRSDHHEAIQAVREFAERRRDFGAIRYTPLDIGGQPARLQQDIPNPQHRGTIDDHYDPPSARLSRTQDRPQQHRQFAHALQYGVVRDDFRQNDGSVSLFRPDNVGLYVALRTLRRPGQYHGTDRSHCRPKQRADSAN